MSGKSKSCEPLGADRVRFGCLCGLWKWTEKTWVAFLRGNDTELIEKEDEAYKGDATVVRP